MSEKTHNGESWPYHKDTKGNLVACASNPCRLHGGKDVMATSIEQAYEILNENSMVGLQTSQQDEASVPNDKPDHPYQWYADARSAAEILGNAQQDAMEKRHLTGIPYHHEDEMQDIENDIRNYLDIALFGDQKEPEMLEAAAKISDEDNAHFASSVAEKMANEIREQSKRKQNEPEPTFTKKVDLENALPAKRSSFTFNPDISSITKPPVHNDNNGYMGGHRFLGGRYSETHMLPNKEVAKLIRSDIKSLKSNSSMPSDWKVSVKTVTYSGGMHYDINVSVPEDSGTPLYRTPTFDDYQSITDGGIRMDMKKEGIDPNNTNEHEYNAFMNRNKDAQYSVLTDDARHTRDAVQEVADQYKMSDVNGMVDYFSVHRSSDVYIHNEYKD